MFCHLRQFYVWRRPLVSPIRGCLHTLPAYLLAYLAYSQTCDKGFISLLSSFSASSPPQLWEVCWKLKPGHFDKGRGFSGCRKLHQYNVLHGSFGLTSSFNRIILASFANTQCPMSPKKLKILFLFLAHKSDSLSWEQFSPNCSCDACDQLSIDLIEVNHWHISFL